MASFPLELRLRARPPCSRFLAVSYDNKKIENFPFRKKIALSRRRRLLEIRDEIFPVSRLLKPREHHLGPLDVLLRRKEVLEQCVFFPLNPRSFVSRRVRVTVRRPCHAAEQTVQVRSLFVAGTLGKNATIRRHRE